MSGNDYELLSAYIDNALTATERANLEARLQAEPRLQQELASLRQTVTLVREMPIIKAPRNFTLSAQMIRRPLPFPLTVTFSALSTAAALLLFVFGGYFLMQTDNMRMNNTAANLQAPAQDQVAAVPTLGREAAQSAAELALPTSTTAPQPAVAANEADDGRTRTTLPATPSPQPTMPPPGVLSNDEQVAQTATVLSSLMYQQAESETSEASAAQAQSSGGGAGADLELFAADSGVAADDMTSSSGFADADTNDTETTPDEGTLEQNDGGSAGGAFMAATAAFAPLPEQVAPQFRLQPTRTITLESPASAQSLGEVAQEPDASIATGGRDEAQEESRNDITEPPQAIMVTAGPSSAQPANDAIVGVGLLLGGGLLLGVAIVTTAVRRRRYS